MLMLIWNEHLKFAEVYALDDVWLTVLNTLFIGLIIFYVYPLRFLTLFFNESVLWHRHLSFDPRCTGATAHDLFWPFAFRGVLRPVSDASAGH